MARTRSTCTQKLETDIKGDIERGKERERGRGTEREKEREGPVSKGANIERYQEESVDNNIY